MQKYKADQTGPNIQFGGFQLGFVRVTGKILKVTVDVKPIEAGIKAEADSAQREAAVKKAISD